MRAPLLEVLFVADTALSCPRSAFDFGLFTTIWEDPKELDAGRFPADILKGFKQVSSVRPLDT